MTNCKLAHINKHTYLNNAECNTSNLIAVHINKVKYRRQLGKLHTVKIVNMRNVLWLFLYQKCHWKSILISNRFISQNSVIKKTVLLLFFNNSRMKNSNEESCSVRYSQSLWINIALGPFSRHSATHRAVQKSA